MIISRAPYRVSFFGGGTDFPEWIAEHGGAVLSCTLPQACYIGMRFMPRFLGSKYIVFWSEAEKVNRLEDIRHPGVYGCLKALDFDEGLGEKMGFEVNHMGDLPARSGLGSSSAFTVAMLRGLFALRRQTIGTDALARMAIHVEQDILQETVGLQDQIACAYGGLNLIEFSRDDWRVTPLPPDCTLESRLSLFFTGIQRYSSEIQDNQVMASREEELKSIASLVPLAIDAIRGRDWDGFGHLLHETWLLKRELSDKVSNSQIDDIYDRAREAGALGGKVLGAGGGGFMVFYSHDRQRLREALPELIEWPFAFGWQGSSVVVDA